MTSEVGIRDLKNHLSEYIEDVERGELLTVTRRGKPVARIMPAEDKTGLEQLIAEGKVRWSGRKPKLPKPIKLQGSGKSLSDYVIEGRR